MNPKELSKAWREPDSMRLSKRQVAIRLPHRVIAGIDAIGVLFPRMNKTEIIGGLLTAALDEFEAGLSDVEPTEAEKGEAKRTGTNAMSERHGYQFITRMRLKYLEDREGANRMFCARASRVGTPTTGTRSA